MRKYEMEFKDNIVDTIRSLRYTAEVDWYRPIADPCVLFGSDMMASLKAYVIDELATENTAKRKHNSDINEIGSICGTRLFYCDWFESDDIIIADGSVNLFCGKHDVKTRTVVMEAQDAIYH